MKLDLTKKRNDHLIEQGRSGICEKTRFDEEKNSTTIDDSQSGVETGQKDSTKHITSASQHQNKPCFFVIQI